VPRKAGLSLRYLTKAGSSRSLPSVVIFFVAAEEVVTLEDALALEDGFAVVVANEDKVENAALALWILEDDPGVGAPARHSALMMVILSHPGVLEISIKASYQ
jgi:hypothetical protein